MRFTDESRRRKRGTRISKKKSRRRPVVVLNAQLRKRQKAVASNAGVIAATMIALAAAAVILFLVTRHLNSVFFSGNDEYVLTNFVVNCESPELKKYVTEQFGTVVGTNLFQIDIQEIQDQAETTANVKSASVFRRLPGTLEIAVEERVPVARLGNRHDRALCLVVDDDGAVFMAKSKSLAKSLPVITGYGSEGNSPGTEIKSALREALVLLGTASRASRTLTIANVDLGEDDHVVAKLLDGPVVKLKWKEEEGERLPIDLEARLKYLCGIMWQREKEGKPLWSVDLRSDDYTRYTPVRPL